MASSAAGGEVPAEGLVRDAGGPVREAVASSLRQAPIVGVVRTTDPEEARRQARLLARAGLELVEITFTVPQAEVLVSELLAERGGSGPPWIGTGTVADLDRLKRALAVGAEFVVTPGCGREVLSAAAAAGRFLIAGALTPTEIVTAWEAGADLVKVYPLPPVGGPAYLATIRQPLGDIPMLAAGGFGVDEIPAYRRAGAVAFGIGAPLLAASDEETVARIRRALQLARGQEG